MKHAARSDNETIVVDMAVLLPPCFGQNQELLEVTAQDREIRKFTLNPELQPSSSFLQTPVLQVANGIGVSRKFRVMRKRRFGSATGNRTRVLRLRISRPNP